MKIQYKFTNQKFTARNLLRVENFIGHIETVMGNFYFESDKVQILKMLDENNTNIEFRIDHSEVDSLKVDVIFLYLQQWFSNKFTMTNSTNRYADWYASYVWIDYIMKCEDPEGKWEKEITILENVTQNNLYFSQCKSKTIHLPAIKEASRKTVENDGLYNIYVQ